jgi:putative nucleotidyltransferase with HDIG domain
VDFRIDLVQVVMALADALDLVGIDEVAHGKRVGYMAFKCAEQAGLLKYERERLFQIGLLHDCGVSSSREHHHLVSELQWDGAEEHAVEGAGLLAGFLPLCDYAEVVRFHHTPWDQLERADGVPLSVQREANLVFLVDRVDAMAAPHYQVDLLQQVERIRHRVSGFSGTLFAPELVDLFLRASASDAFWMMLEPPHLERFVFSMEQRADRRDLGLDEVRQLARIFAHVVDAKSAFTAQHSLGVASLARHLALAAGLDPLQVDKVEVAGLLHDIGKLRIPDEILEKPGRLSDDEIRIMHRHSFETYQVLRRIDGLADIALWAAYHHETPDGRGYPFGRHGEELGLEARVIAVADVFQALAQRRPYRPAMAPSDILLALDGFVAAGKLDAALVGLVAADLDGCYRAALANPATEHEPRGAETA